MNEREIKILTERLIPVPEKITFSDGDDYILKNGCQVRINAAQTVGIAEKAEALFKAYWNAMPVINLVQTEWNGHAEGYSVEVKPDCMEIGCSGMDGMMNAMKTLRQLAEVQRGTERVEEYFLVQCRIDDKPAMAFRGLHLCIFPETPLWDIERQIRLAAAHKFNYAVIESWGIFPFESHPEFCWTDKKLDKKELKRIIELGKDLGITLVPQFNLLGHAAASRSITGKHAVLSLDPALQPLFEPDGWSWCLTNPATRRILTDLVTELHEFYGNPAFFHIGCDEADNIATCRDCRRKVLKDLVKEHICYFHDLFAARGARVIMWHDMLLDRSDPRWKNYIVCGLAEHQLSELYKELPRDIVIADWQYGYPKEKEDDPEPAWPTSRFFKAENFDVLVCPWINNNGTRSLGKFAAEEQLLGMLETTWHISHGMEHALIYCTAACAAWNPAANPGVSITTRLSVSQHVRQIGWDMGINDYTLTGWNMYQVDPGYHPNK